MGSHTWRPRSAKATAITFHADFNEHSGWSVSFTKYAPGDAGMVRSRMVYDGLSDAELVDVMDVELSQALQLI